MIYVHFIKDCSVTPQVVAKGLNMTYLCMLAFSPQI